MNGAKNMTAADDQQESNAGDQMPSWREVFLYFLFLGFVVAAFAVSLLPDGRDVGERDPRGWWPGTR